jgi:signal transduction histidine kinase
MKLPRTLKRLIPKAKPISMSSEFLAWRQQFLPGRLQLLAWIVLIVLILVTVLNLTVTIPSLNASGDPKFAFGAARLRVYLTTTISQILSVFVGVLVTQSRWIRQTPERVFLLFNALVLLPMQVVAALRGEVSFDGEIWLIYFAIQAILVPVYWQLHVLAQVVALGYFVTAFSLGWRDPNVIVPAAYVLSGVYTIFICAVSDTGVFLYERSRRRELELRQQLRVFIHAVSHDLRNPVLGMVMTLKSFVKPSREAAAIPQELLEQMIASGDRQVALLNSLLEAHETELHGFILHRQSVKLDELVNAITNDFQPFFQQTKATLSNYIASDLPPINGDPLHLRRVYENLLSNALKYNHPGLHLTLTAEVVSSGKPRRWRDGEMQRKTHSAFNTSGEAWRSPHSTLHCLRCTVMDDGVGMTQQQSDHLFNLYNRGRDQRRSLSLGLGLYMCRQIITAHGGEIGVISSPGQGAKFWFTLPIQN